MKAHEFQTVAVAFVSFEKARGRRPAVAHVSAMTGISYYKCRYAMQALIASNKNIYEIAQPTREMIKKALAVEVLSEAQINAKKAVGGSKATRSRRRWNEQEAIERVVKQAKEKEGGFDVVNDHRRPFRTMKAQRIG